MQEMTYNTGIYPRSKTAYADCRFLCICMMWYKVLLLALCGCILIQNYMCRVSSETALELSANYMMKIMTTTPFSIFVVSEYV